MKVEFKLEYDGGGFLLSSYGGFGLCYEGVYRYFSMPLTTNTAYLMLSTTKPRHKQYYEVVRTPELNCYTFSDKEVAKWDGMPTYSPWPWTLDEAVKRATNYATHLYAWLEY